MLILWLWNCSRFFYEVDHPAIQGHQVESKDQKLEDLLYLDETTAIAGVQCQCLKTALIW